MDLAIKMKFLSVIFLAAYVEAKMRTLFDYNNDPGVCSQTVSYIASRYVPYHETYRVSTWGIFYETKVRRNYRKEYYTDYRTEKVCCPLYKTAEDGDCHPICEPECVNGKCVSPGICDCFWDYKKNLIDHVCEPICYNCSHGKCVEPNVCKCDTGYRRGMGEFTCETACDVVCEQEQAYCSGPNECTCHESYTLKVTSARCLPICDFGCENGECTAPNVCTCTKGYSPKNGTFCEPVCKEPCINGYCSAPDTCSCNSGYKLSDNSFYLCEPICQQSCINGHCSEPNKCSCKEGYRPLRNNTNICEPICEQDCMNGFCSAPNQCSCKEGYSLPHDSSSICEPVCKEPCGQNSICAAPGTCECEEGYRPLNRETKFVCVPVCDLDCENNSCSLETCECNAGYTLKIEETHLQNRSTCEPVCENCTHGRCVGPNDCQCDVGFVKAGKNSDSDGECVSLCRNNCNDHGICLENATCECYWGWTGLHCDRPSFCIFTMNEYSNKTNIVSYMNDTIANVFANSPSCALNSCIDEINNQTLCIDKYRIDNSENYTVGCLISSDSVCYMVLSQYSRLPRYVTIAGIMGIIIVLVTVPAMVYLLMRKYKERRFSFGNGSTISMQEELTRGRQQSLASSNQKL